MPPQAGVQISYSQDASGIPVESMRVELATLLASVRGGALTEGERPSKSRGARIDLESVDKDDTPQQAREEVVERSTQIWGQLHRAMQAVRQYAWEHPHTTSYFENAANLVKEAHAQWPSSVRFDVGTTSLNYDRTPVWKPNRPPFDTIPYQLFVDGLRTLQLKVGIEQWELRELAAVMLRDTGAGLVSDDDTVTALWNRKLPHVGYAAVDAYIDSDDPEFEKDLDALEKELTDLCNFDDVDGMNARLDAQRQVADEAVALTLSEQARERLSKGVEIADEEWSAVVARVFPGALREAEIVGDGNALLGGLESFAAEAVAIGQCGVVFDVFSNLVAAVEQAGGEQRARAFEQIVVGTVFSAERLQRIVQDIRRAPGEQAIRSLEHVLGLMPDDRFFDGASEVFWDVPAAMQLPLLAYQVRFAHGRESVFEAILSRGDPILATAALRGLASLSTSQARDVMLRAFDNPHLEVKVSAVEFLPDAAAENVRGEVAKLLDDPSAEVRLSTLGVLSQLGSTAVGPVLVRRIQTTDLSLLSEQEQRLLLSTLVKLSPRRGSEIAIEILDRTQMVPTQGPEQTRAIAAEALAFVDADGVAQALERAARKKWTNSTPVREAAQSALANLRARAVGATSKGSR